MKKNISQLKTGLHRDFNIEDQPKGTYRFALNAINSSIEGDKSLKSNEEGNEVFCNLPEDTTIIGKIYFKTDKVLLFLAKNDNSVSHIGVFDTTLETFTTVVDDTLSTDKLGFKVTNQIQGVYRNRKGCEDTFYFVGKGYPPRFFSFSSLESFKDSFGNWAASQFSLLAMYKKIPIWDDIEIKEGIGGLKSGTYIYAIQLLDSDLTPTEAVNFSKSVKIYKDNTNGYYPTVSGSITSESEALNVGATGKAVKLKLADLDEEYPFYRVVILCANSGAGVINDVYLSNPINITTHTFTHTGLETFQKGNINEVTLFQNIISSATSIEQIDNRLILGDITGPQEDYCQLQYYASKITTDCILKEVNLNTFNDPANTKNGEHEFFDGVGFMPGEIYSFGIVYIFEDNTLSPSYHIPGKRDYDVNTVFSPENDAQNNPIVFPMAINNNCKNVKYPEMGVSCNAGGYWGKDYAGYSLNNAYVRHHRFPTRKQLNIRTADVTTDTSSTYNEYSILFNVKGDLLLPTPCPVLNPDCGTDYLPPFYFKISYTIDGILDFYIVEINPNSYQSGTNFSLNLNSVFANTPNSTLTVIGIEVTDLNGVYQDANTFDYSVYFSSSVIGNLSATVQTQTQTVNKVYYKGKILGLKLSNIELPPITATGGKKIIGYYITRQDRTEDDKTVLDSAVMFPNYKSNNNKYIGSGLLKYEGKELMTRAKKSYSFISLEHRFLNREYTAIKEIEVQGEYYNVPTQWSSSDNKYRSSYYSLFRYNDVFDGSTWNKDLNRKNDDDAKDPDGLPNTKGHDGWTIDVAVRDTFVAYDKNITAPDIQNKTISRTYYLDALDSKFSTDLETETYNLATDNKVGIIEYGKDCNLPADRYPYVLLKRGIEDPYGDFLQRPYFIQDKNPVYFGNDTKVIHKLFSGDSYLSPLRPLNTLYFQNRPAYRNLKLSVWKIIVGIIVAAGAAVLAGFTGSGSIVAAAPIISTLLSTSIAVAGAGLMLAGSGIKQVAMAKAYGDAYGKGLKNTIDDWFFKCMFHPYTSNNLNMANTDSHYPFYPLTFLNSKGQDGPSDDTIEYGVDILTNIFLDSTVNTNLRNSLASDELSSFAQSPWHRETGQYFGIGYIDIGSREYIDSNQTRYPISSVERHIEKKLLKFSPKRNDMREYIGVPLGEYHFINPDYFVNNHIRPIFAIGYGYDCCNGCNEYFPHRVLYSEQSFQEELTDNYRKFLPNNYIDIDGSTGSIINIYALSNNLYIHTEEALYQLPRHQQQMVVDQILTFVGTGEYFSIPPIKMIDDNTGHSFGCRHKWSAIKTPHGVFFVSELQGQICLLKTNGVESITLNTGLNKWFKENIKIKFDDIIYKITDSKYTFRDNPSSPFGTGYITTYDSLNERFIVTKKDFINESLINSSDIKFCSKNGKLYAFPNYQETIDNKILDGWTYKGIKNCRMKFSAVTKNGDSSPTVVARPNESFTSKDVVVYFAIDPSNPILPSIKNRVNTWFDEMRDKYENAVNKLFFVYDWENKYRWLRSLESTVNGTGNIFLSDYKSGIEYPSTFASISKDINVISITDDTDYYHSNVFDVLNINTPNLDYISDFNNFFISYDTLLSSGYNMTFNNIFYIDEFETADVIKTKLQHIIASTYLDFPTLTGLQSVMELSNPLQNYVDTQFVNTLGLSNPYPQDTVTNHGPLSELGMVNKVYSTIDIDLAFTDGISEIDTFEYASKDFIWHSGDTLEFESMVYSYVDGVELSLEKNINASWTMSYDILEKHWISWHSYLPNFYVHTPGKYFSWISGDKGIYRHLVLGKYNHYYGTQYPFLLEIVSNSNTLVPRIFENIDFYTKALVYDVNTNSYREEPLISFNKVLFYNSRQISGWKDLKVKDNSSTAWSYLQEQIQNDFNTCLIDRNEGIWSINNLRDYRKNQTDTMFIENLNQIQNSYYIDKEVNVLNIDLQKNWYEIELFRDRFLVVRFLFDNFENVKLLMATTAENENESIRI